MTEQVELPQGACTATSLRGRPFRHDLAALWPTAGVTCVSPAVKALLAEGSGPEAVVKVER
ncbi:MAG: hypothetical protein M3450_06410, partial [Actinomycetota bacterium]|nr:hypothetical protein [Actinomycetota bacterium]